MKMLLCLTTELLRKDPRVNLKSLLGSVGVALKVAINKLLEECPTATFAGVLAMNRINVSKNPLLNPRSSADTGS